MAPFRWTGKREQAALMVAQDDMTNEQIATSVGVRRQTLDRWKAHPDFKAKVEQLLADMRAAIRAKGIADKQARIAILDDVHQRMLKVVEARARDLQGEVAGGDTGLLVRQPKLVKVYESDGEDGGEPEGLRSAKREVMVYEYAFDAALAKEIREYAKQAAQEKGEWSEKREITGKDGGPIDVKVEDAREQLAARLAALATRRRESSADSQPEPTGSGEATL